MKNKLYIGATPIGNLKQISNELLDVFLNIKYIFCEDTRVTKKLLTCLNIDFCGKIFISNHNFNEHNKIDEFAKIIASNDVLLVSDAGYPLISDPGYNVVNYCINQNIPIEVINGPCSIIHALVKSGFNLSSFMFVGFLDNNKNKQIQKLTNLKKIETILVIFESVHKIINTLKNINEIFKENLICVAKELSKLNETFFYGKAYEIINQLNQDNLKGEFIILIDNSNLDIYNEIDKDILAKIDILKQANLPNKSILDILIIDYPKEKNKIYQWLLNKDKNE